MQPVREWSDWPTGKDHLGRIVAGRKPNRGFRAPHPSIDLLDAEGRTRARWGPGQMEAGPANERREALAYWGTPRRSPGGTTGRRPRPRLRSRPRKKGRAVLRGRLKGAETRILPVTRSFFEFVRLARPRGYHRESTLSNGRDTCFVNIVRRESLKVHFGGTRPFSTRPPRVRD